MKIYNHIILGGTFDRFHVGHAHMIRTASTIAMRMTIGITTPIMHKTKLLSPSIQDYDIRSSYVRDFLKKTAPRVPSQLIPLSDIYGTSMTDYTVDAILVTSHTKKGGLMINKKRIQLGMKPLDIIMTSLIKGDDNKIISSERIRYGDIDREGKNYYKWLISTKKWGLPDKLKAVLREPLGDVIFGDISHKKSVVNEMVKTIRTRKPPAIFAIGDIIVASLYERSIAPSISIIDFLSRREAVEETQMSKFKTQIVKRYRNRAGTIERGAVSRIKLLRDRYMNNNKPQVLGIWGEEDLLALPSILLAPLDSVVLYGQYNLGVVVVQITEQKKIQVFQLLQKFIP